MTSGSCSLTVETVGIPFADEHGTPAKRRDFQHSFARSVL